MVVPDIFPVILILYVPAESSEIAERTLFAVTSRSFTSSFVSSVFVLSLSTVSPVTASVQPMNVNIVTISIANKYFFINIPLVNFNFLLHTEKILVLFYEMLK